MLTAHQEVREPAVQVHRWRRIIPQTHVQVDTDSIAELQALQKTVRGCTVKCSNILF